MEQLVEKIAAQVWKVRRSQPHTRSRKFIWPLLKEEKPDVAEQVLATTKEVIEAIIETGFSITLAPQPARLRPIQPKRMVITREPDKPRHMVIKQQAQVQPKKRSLK